MNNFYKDVHFDIPQGYYLHGVESVHDYTDYKRQYARYRVVNTCVLYTIQEEKNKKSDLPIARGPWDTNMQCIYKVMLIGLLTRLHTIANKLV